jgi:hypothetical protein
MRLLIWSTSLALVGCAAGQGATQESEAFARDLATRTAGEPRNCIPATAGQGLTIVDRRTVIADRGGTIWVNRLEADCPGMRPLGTLVVQTQGSQYCRGDQVRAIEPGLTIPGPICILREFTPYRRRG